MLCSSYYTSYYTEEPTTQRRSTRSQASIPKKSSVPVSPAVIPISAGLTPEGGTDSPNQPSRGGYGDKTPASEEFAPLKPMKSVEGLESRCPTQRPIHCVLTAQATVYQQWQARIMYFHWKKQARADGECTDMTGFTRLVASENGKPDGLEDEMPSVFVKQLSQMELSKLGHFGVLNRPYSVVQFIAAGHLTRIKESFVYIAEVRDCPRVNASLLLFLLCLSSQTDHVFMKPLKNLATDDTPVAFGFGYMFCSQHHQSTIDKHSPGTSWRDVQNVGPSPLMISKEQLEKVTGLWYNLSLSLKRDPVADRRFGWVLEMWGYSIAAASLHINHRVLGQFQVEGGAGIGVPRDRYIFHYTYGIEYSLSGKPQTGRIGEWSLDKRHYGTSYPPRNLRPPPDSASDGAKWLLHAFNEASAGIEAWPLTKALGTVGWRRDAGTGIEGSQLANRIIGTSWTWSGITGLAFQREGQAKTPWGTGVWGILPKDIDYNDDGFCEVGCAFLDFSGALHNLRFDWTATPSTFKTYRIGDGESIAGVQVKD
ncbi:MAG: hypothetical protein SGPRY_004000 [Prymnesium sp.]